MMIVVVKACVWGWKMPRSIPSPII